MLSQPVWVNHGGLFGQPRTAEMQEQEYTLAQEQYNKEQMYMRALIHRLLHEAQDRWPVGAEIPREEVLAWLDSRTTHWFANARLDRQEEAR